MRTYVANQPNHISNTRDAFRELFLRYQQFKPLGKHTIFDVFIVTNCFKRASYENAKPIWCKLSYARCLRIDSSDPIRNGVSCKVVGWVNNCQVAAMEPNQPMQLFVTPDGNFVACLTNGNPINSEPSCSLFILSFGAVMKREPMRRLCAALWTNKNSVARNAVIAIGHCESDAQRRASPAGQQRREATLLNGLVEALVRAGQACCPTQCRADTEHDPSARSQKRNDRREPSAS